MRRAALGGGAAGIGAGAEGGGGGGGAGVDAGAEGGGGGGGAGGSDGEGAASDDDAGGGGAGGGAAAAAAPPPPADAAPPLGPLWAPAAPAANPGRRFPSPPQRQQSAQTMRALQAAAARGEVQTACALADSLFAEGRGESV